VVHAFFPAMELALGAATVAISRAGASSLAELAAMRLPAMLIPFPWATDNHQFHNARAYEASGAARLLEEKPATPEALRQALVDLVQDGIARQRMQDSLARWHKPHAAQAIADALLDVIAARGAQPALAAASSTVPARQQPAGMHTQTNAAAPETLDTPGPADPTPACGAGILPARRDSLPIV
jgi:hypothetical protein